MEIGPAGAGGATGSARVRVRAVPADHAGTRYPLASEAPALGYVVAGGMSAYFAGDTGLYDAMRELGPIDVAVLPVGGWGPRLPSDHLNPLSAAKALELLRPAACVPVHWGTIYPPWLPPAFNAKWGEWPHAFARYAAHLAPEVDVRVLQPGETTVFTPKEATAQAASERDAASGREASGGPRCDRGGPTGVSATQLRIAFLQLAGSGYDRDASLDRGLSACRQAAAAGADLALFPELWSTGYAFSDGDLERWRAQAIARNDPWVVAHADLAAELGMAIAATYLEASGSGRATSSPCSTARAARRSRTPRSTPAASTCPSRRSRPGREFPVARLETRAGSVHVGAMICFDREFPEAARALALGGAELILVPNACALEENRLGQVRARAFENMVAVAVANYAAPDGADALEENGHSTLVDPIAFDAEGRSRDTRVFEAGEAEDVCVVRLDLDALREWRRREVWGSQCRRPEAYGALVEDAGRGHRTPERRARRPAHAGCRRLSALSEDARGRPVSRPARSPHAAAAARSIPYGGCAADGHSGSVVEVARRALVAVQRLGPLDDLRVGPVGGVLEASDLGPEVVGAGREDRLDGERRRVLGVEDLRSSCL